MAESSLQYKLPLIVAVTGHRDLLDAQLPGIRAAVRTCLEQLMARYPERELHLLTGLAEGADQLAADVAFEVGYRVIAVLPMDAKIYRDDFVSDDSARAFDSRLAQVDEVIELPPARGAQPEELASPGPGRDAQYAQLGVFLAAHCHLLLALWDGKPGDEVGGTGSVVQFHHDNIMPGYTDPVFATQQMLIDDESDLVYHVVCSRDRPDGDPASGLKPLDTWWYSKDADEPRSKTMPVQHERIFSRSAEFSRDCQKHAAMIDVDAYPLYEQDEAASLPANVAEINRWFCGADVLAMHYQRKVVRTLRITHALAFLMGFSFILYADVQTERAFLVAFLVFFGVSAVFQQVAKRRRWHRKYFDYRTLAEGLRVQFFWAVAGVRDETDSQFTHDNFLRSQEPELGWIRNVMRAAGLRTDAAMPREQSGLDFVLREWIGDDDNGQLAYFARRTVDRVRRNQLTESLGILSLLTSVVMIMLFVLAGSYVPDDWIGPLLAAMGALLLVYGIRQGYAYALAEKELIKQYRFMLRLFTNAKLRIDTASGAVEQRQILRALGRAALDEHSEWLMMHRSRSVEQGEIWRMGS